jgi:Helix-turn-helix.
MENIYMLADAEIMHKIASKIKEVRLKQNLTQKNLSEDAGISLSSIKRIEDGDIKTFSSILRILRTLGKLDIFQSLIDEEPLSPNEYFKLVNSKTTKRHRATKNNKSKSKEDLKW